MCRWCHLSLRERSVRYEPGEGVRMARVRVSCPSHPSSQNPKASFRTPKSHKLALKSPWLVGYKRDI
jgi:hypothetical protein